MLVKIIVACIVTASADNSDGNSDISSIISINILTWEGSSPYVELNQDEYALSSNFENQSISKYDGILVQFFHSLKVAGYGGYCNTLNLRVKNICFIKYETFYAVLHNSSLLNTLSKCRFEYDNNTITVLAPTSRNIERNIERNIQIVFFTWAFRAAVIVRGNDISLFAKAFKGIQDSIPLIYLSVILAVIVGALVWLLEHRGNESFHSNYSQGLWSGFWFSFVTMTTVGYGDKVPKHFLSRLIILAWIYIGMLLIASITAVVMNAVTSNLDLTGKNVSILKGHIEETRVRSSLKGVKKSYYSYDDVLEAVINKEVDAALIEGGVLSKVMKAKENGASLSIEREIGNVDISVYLAIATNFSSSQKNLLYNCLKDNIHNEAMTADLYFKFIEPYQTTPFLVRPLTSIFSTHGNQDMILVYTTGAALLLIGLAVIFLAYRLLKNKFGRTSK